MPLRERSTAQVVLAPQGAPSAGSRTAPNSSFAWFVLGIIPSVTSDQFPCSAVHADKHKL
eukprot:scaffold22703_cov57-Phaeocystis_antarctica.AAC.2